LEAHADDEIPYEDPYFWAGFVFNGKDLERRAVSQQLEQAAGIQFYTHNNKFRTLSKDDLQAIETSPADRSKDQEQLIAAIAKKVNLRDAQIDLRSCCKANTRAGGAYGRKLVEFSSIVAAFAMSFIASQSSIPRCRRFVSESKLQ